MFTKKPLKPKGKSTSLFIPADMLDYFDNLKKRGLPLSYTIIEFFRNSKDYKQYLKEEKKK